jgi:aromatic-L-amino-acid/L-tryptophan decarboxylase
LLVCFISIRLSCVGNNHCHRTVGAESPKQTFIKTYPYLHVELKLIMLKTSENTLDPDDWPSFRKQGHRMLDDMFDYLEQLREQPVWQGLPAEQRDVFQRPLLNEFSELNEVHDIFMKTILPYAVGNTHPGFMGWVHGGGTPVGMLAEMLAAGLNANVGGRDQAPIELEKQLLQWIKSIFSFPETAGGLFVTGTSMANLISVLIARTVYLGKAIRKEGLVNSDLQLVAYTSESAHISIAQAMDIAGIGSNALRMIPTNAMYQMDVSALAQAISADKKAGLTPFFIAATIGTVDVGAIDPLPAIADLAKRENLWFHVDGAYGALAILAPDIAPRLQGIERADSIAFDFHKWGQVPYDAGFILVRNGELQLDTFAMPAAYLSRESRGLSAGSPWPCDLGPELSRGFRALKTWFTIKVYGQEKLGQVISNTCALAQYLKQRIELNPKLELLASVELNIVCFRYRCLNPNRINADIVIALQESGIVAPSTTTLHGQLAIRAAIVNHRTTSSDIDALIEATLAFGKIIENTIAP